MTAKPISAVPHRQQAGNTNVPTTSHLPTIISSIAREVSPSSSVLTTSSTQPLSSSPPSIDERKSAHAGRKHVVVSAEVARSRLLWSTAGVKGAIVALTLGIVVTVLTLLYIGCHYRHQRKLTRRHRHLPTGSNDADYLVNGMYL